MVVVVAGGDAGTLGWWRVALGGTGCRRWQGVTQWQGCHGVTR